MREHRLPAKMIRLIVLNSRSDLQVTSVCATTIKEKIDDMLREREKTGRTGNWCTQEYWDTRQKELEIVSRILGKIEKIEAI